MTAAPEAARRWRVLLADDHAMLREGLHMLIETQADLEVVGHAGDGLAAVRLATELRPDVVVLDVSMPGLGGVEAAARIVAACPQVGILAVTRHTDPAYLRRMLQAGARGYLLKRAAAEVLLDAIRTVAAGGSHIDAKLAGALLVAARERRPQPDPGRALQPLSEREQQVLKLIAWGRIGKEIAQQLDLSIKTVESYKATALAKLGLRTRADILRHALGEGWLDTDEAPD